MVDDSTAAYDHDHWDDESYNDDADLFVLENPWRDHPGFDVADLIFTDFRISDHDRIIIAGKHLD